jgi:hypothetical protein
MKTDRLKTLSFCIVVVIGIAMWGEVSSHDRVFACMATLLILLLITIQTIRLDFRDLREEISKKAVKPEGLPEQTI